MVSNTQTSLKTTNYNNNIMTSSDNQHSAKYYFDLLDTELAKQTPEKKEEEELCCSNPDKIISNERECCKNCGRSDINPVVSLDSDWLSDNNRGGTVNPLLPKLSMRTYLSYMPGKKAAALRRIHQWNSYDYKEGKIGNCYILIDELIAKIGIELRPKVNSNAKIIYKNIYIDYNDTSRGNIKRSLIVFSILCALDHLEIEYNILEILKTTGVSIEQYNFGISKIETDEKVFLHENIEEFKQIANNYTQINIKQVIDIYNENLQKKKDNGYCINSKTLLISSIYMLIEKNLNKKTFCKEFSITNTTLNKALRVLNPANTKKKKPRKKRAKKAVAVAVE